MKKLFLIALAAISVVSCTSYEKRLAECSSVGDFKDGYALCEQDFKYFFINESGRRKSPKYDYADEFCNGYAVVGKEKDYVMAYDIVDTDFRKVAGPIGAYRGGVNEWGNIWMRTAVRLNSEYRWGLMNVATGTFRTGLVDNVDCISEDGIAVVSSFEKDKRYYEYAIYDGKGTEIIPLGKYSFIGNFSSGRAQYSTNGYMHLPTPGDTYEDSKEKTGSLFRRTNSDSYETKLGYIDTYGNIVIPAVYNKAYPFNSAGYAHVYKGVDRVSSYAREYVIDTEGRELTGKELGLAEATFLEDGQWHIGKDDAGKPFLVNNKLREVAFDAGSLLAMVKDDKDYLMVRKGGDYKLYVMTSDDVLLYGSFKAAADATVVLTEGRDGRCVRFYRSSPVSFYERYVFFYDEYDVKGQFIQSGKSRLSNRTMKTFTFTK